MRDGNLIRGPVQQVRRDWERGRLKPVSDDAEANVKQLSIVEQNVDRLQRLIGQVLGLARLEAGTYELDPRSTDIETTVERLARGFEPLAERSNLDLTVNMEGSTSETAGETREGEPLYVDREALEHVLSNLMSNAIKFTPRGGSVEVVLREQEEGAEIVIRDTGTGIPEEKQEAIFERFAQVDDTATREQEGAGIGLAFTKDLVDLHGGTIHLNSVEDEGTTVTVRLPRGTDHLPNGGGPHRSDVESAAESPRSEDMSRDFVSTVHRGGATPEAVSDSDEVARSGATRSPDDPSTTTSEAQTKLVLVVDDNADVRRYVRSVLEATFTVVEATNGKEGLAAAREQIPDVILVDVMMPSMDGHELTRRLKEEPETEAIPVIMVTARAETQDEVTGLKVGANDYVTKPFDADVLRQRVGGVLTLQQRLRRRLEATIRDETSLDGASASPEAQHRPEIERRAQTIIREHLTESDFQVTDLAEEMAMSRSTLYRKLKAEGETTPSALMTQVRIEEAKALLRDGEPVTQVAYAVGYDRLSTFTSIFTDHMGHPPSALTTDAPH